MYSWAAMMVAISFNGEGDSGISKACDADLLRQSSIGIAWVEGLQDCGLIFTKLVQPRRGRKAGGREKKNWWTKPATSDGIEEPNFLFRYERFVVRTDYRTNMVKLDSLHYFLFSLGFL